MQIKNKALISRKPLVLEYTLLCKNCGYLEKKNGNGSDAMKFLSQGCPKCSIPKCSIISETTTVSSPEPVIVREYEPKILKVKKVFHPHKKKR